MKTYINLQIIRVLLFTILLAFGNLFAEKYIGIEGPHEQIWWGSPVNMGAYNIVHWKNLNVDWYLNVNGSGGDVTFQQTQTAVQNAFNSWENVSTASISFDYMGSTAAEWENDGKNVFYWATSEEDDAYGQGGPLMVAPYPGGGGAMAMTVITFNSSQELLDVDILFDGFYRNWGVNGTGSDIEGVSAHEIGHMIGLHHTEVDSSPEPTMYSGPIKTTELRSLEFDDEVGVSFLYGGNLIDNETFSGTDYYDWNINLMSNKTLTIQSGSSLKFENDCGITIYGTLIVF